MTDISPANNVADKLASLQKEAEYLKSRLEEERQKLNDVTRTKFCFIDFYVFVLLMSVFSIAQFQLQLIELK